MRKLLLAIALTGSVSVTFAQDLKDIADKISKGKYDEAKEKLDKFMADPKNANDPGAYFYRGVINNYYAQADSTGKLTYDAGMEAFNAYKKSYELDPKNKYLMLDQNNGLVQLYAMYYNRAVASYNNKNYDVAFKAFKNAVDVEDYMRNKGLSSLNFTPPALDTQLVNLTATSAFLAKQEDLSIPYFERLADAKLNGKEYKEIYALLAQHYMGRNNDAAASKYISIGKELFKDDDYWLSLEFNTNELRDMDKQLTALHAKYDKATEADKKTVQAEIDALQDKQKEARLKRYEEILQKYPNNAPLATDYAIELYNSAYVWAKKPSNYTDRQAKLQTALDKALTLDPNSAITHFIASQHYYSQVFDLEDAKRLIKGNTPADNAKRKDLNAQIDKKYDDMAAASQKAFDIYAAMPELKMQDKTNYKKVIDQLVDYYGRKKMSDKVTFYQNKKASIK